MNLHLNTPYMDLALLYPSTPLSRRKNNVIRKRERSWEEGKRRGCSYSHHHLDRFFWPMRNPSMTFLCMIGLTTPLQTALGLMMTAMMHGQCVTMVWLVSCSCLMATVMEADVSFDARMAW